MLASTAKFDDPLVSLLAPHHDFSLLVPPKHSQTSFNDPPRGRALKHRAPFASGPSNGTHIAAIVAVDIRFIVLGENIGDAEVPGAGGRRGSEGQRFKEELGGVIAVLLHMDTQGSGEINALRKFDRVCELNLQRQNGREKKSSATDWGERGLTRFPRPRENSLSVRSLNRDLCFLMVCQTRLIDSDKTSNSCVLSTIRSFSQKKKKKQ